MISLHTKEAFAYYESVRHRLPQASFTHSTQTLHTLEEMVEVADGFLLDAFGVLNVGDKAIPKAIWLITTLRKRGKRFCILSNSATSSKMALLNFFHSLGFDFAPHEIITSREVLWHTLPLDRFEQWGVIAPSIATLEKEFLTVDIHHETFLHSDAFLFLGSHTWNDALHVKLKMALKERPRPMWIGNPDITAPRGNAHYSLEPGYYTLLEEETLFQNFHFVGKPFKEVFLYAIDKAWNEWQIPKERLVMVGDTLHTDILGATSVGLQTLLVEDYGFFAEENVEPYIAQSHIIPHFRLSRYD